MTVGELLWVIDEGYTVLIEDNDEGTRISTEGYLEINDGENVNKVSFDEWRTYWDRTVDTVVAYMNCNMDTVFYIYMQGESE